MLRFAAEELYIAEEDGPLAAGLGPSTEGHNSVVVEQCFSKAAPRGAAAIRSTTRRLRFAAVASWVSEEDGMRVAGFGATTQELIFAAVEL